MPGRTTAKIILYVVAYLALITTLRYEPWKRAAGSYAKDRLAVGFLPVT